MLSNEPHFRVLSIDFDFFQDTDAYTMVSNYPDGIDATTFLSSLIWIGHYAKKPNQEKGLIDSVSINEHLFKQIVQVIRNQENHQIPVLVCNSHIHIYNEIINGYPEWEEDGGQLFIDHIDFHHDFENGNKEVDCGNWLGKVLEKYPNAHVRWFARELGVDIFKIDREKLAPYAFNLDDILNQQYDFIFLCRSDNWLPPHLDPYFHDLLNELYTVFGVNDVDVQDCVLMPRCLPDILKSAKVQEEFYAKNFNKPWSVRTIAEGDENADSNPTG